MTVTETLDTACAVAVHTGLGWIALQFRGDRVGRLTFGHPSQAAAVAELALRQPCQDPSEDALRPYEALSAVQQQVVDLLTAYAAGSVSDLSEIAIDIEPATEFQARVWQACRSIPPGETISYGQLAQAVGSPKAARAVGSCMANNRIPLLIPCHRVVGSSGKLHGFSAPQGLTMKRRLLDLEQTANASGAPAALALS